MTETTRIHVAAPARGQFVQLALMPRGTPPLLIAARAWVRLLRGPIEHDHGGVDSQLHAIEAWGESTAIADGVLTVSEGALDIAPASLPGMDALYDGVLRSVVHVDSVVHGVTDRHDESRAAGWMHRRTWITDRVRIDLRAFAPWRAPWERVSIAAERLEDTASTLIVDVVLPGVGTISIPVGLIGQVAHRAETFHLPRVAGEPEELRLAHENAAAFEHYALAETWRGDCLGWPITASPWTVEQARSLAPVLLSTVQNPNETGIKPFYAISLAPLLWCRDGVCRSNLDVIVKAAEQWLDRQATWFVRDGSEIAAWPARPALTMHNSKPWIDDRQDQYDDLGYGKARGTHWTQDAIGEHDNQHENAEALAIAARATIDPAFEIAARAKLVAITYDRAWCGHLDGSWAMPPQGRTAARPGLAMLALGGIDDGTLAIAQRVTGVWVDAMLRGIRSRGIPRARPVQVAGAQPGPLIVPYEEGLIGSWASRAWRMFGSAAALEVAFLYGRTSATGVYWDATGAISVGYEVPLRSDGVPWQPRDGGVVIGGVDLATWLVAGLNAFLSARVAMHAAGIAGEADDPTWVEIAMRARRELTSDLALDRPVQALVRVCQTLWRADIAQLATRSEVPA